MRLSELKEKEKGIITKVLGRGTFRKRLIEMGFVKGKEVTVIKYAPLKDPIEYNILGYEVSLRKSEANLVEIETEKKDEEIIISNNGILIESELDWKKRAIEKSKEINIALVGNPNCGKTTLFNVTTGSDEHVGNYGGVTVDSKIGNYKYNGYKFKVVDLPGTYSLTAYSPEEIFVRRHIFEQMPDVIVNVVDASNLERNLYLTSQLIDMDFKVVMALNIYDELLAKGDKLDIENLSTLIGIPIIPTIASKGNGTELLFEKIIKAYEDDEPNLRHIHINYGEEIETRIKELQKIIKIRENKWLTDSISSRFIAVKLLEKDSDVKKIVEKCRNSQEIKTASENLIKKLESVLNNDTETLITDSRYGFVAGALRETYTEGKIDKPLDAG